MSVLHLLSSSPLTANPAYLLQLLKFHLEQSSWLLVLSQAASAPRHRSLGSAPKPQGIKLQLQTGPQENSKPTCMLGATALKTVCWWECLLVENKSSRGAKVRTGNMRTFLIPWGSLKSENSASMALLGNEGSRRRSSWSMDTCDCLWAVGIFWVREMRNNTLPTSSSFRVNT